MCWIDFSTRHRSKCQPRGQTGDPLSRAPLFGSKAAAIVLSGAFVVLLFNAGQRFSIGLFLKPMVDDLGWTRSTLSLAVTAFLVISALGLPFAGRFVDVFGAARVLGVSALVAGLATALMAFIESPWQAFVLYGFIFAIGSAGTSIAPVSVLVNQWFPDRVGLAGTLRSCTVRRSNEREQKHQDVRLKYHATSKD